MEEFKTQEQAREAIRDMFENATEEENQKIQEILDLTKDLSADNEEFAFITSMLELPEDQFSWLAPAYLDEFEKELNKPNNQRLLIQSLNATGQTGAEIAEQFIKANDELDAILNQGGGALSAQKIDFVKRLLEIVTNAYCSTEGSAKRVVIIPLSYCREDAKMPAYAHLTDAGMDVFATEDITVKPGETILVPLGIKVAIPMGYELQVRPKSGRALKTKLRVANTPGTIDSGYRDEVCVIIENIEPAIKDIDYDFDDNGNIIIKSILHGSDFTIGKGEKFAQLVLAEVTRASFMEVDDVTTIENDGRSGGFGSSGLK